MLARHVQLARKVIDRHLAPADARHRGVDARIRLCRQSAPRQLPLQRGDPLGQRIPFRPQARIEGAALEEGELDLDESMRVLSEIGYEGMVAVELSRHSHAAHETVPAAKSALRAAEREAIR